MSSFGMGMGQRLDMRPDLRITPRMIQSMEVLQMPATELLEKVQEALQENPFLEHLDARPEIVDAPPEPDFNPDGILKHDPAGESAFSRMDEINRDWEDHFDSDHRPSRGALAEMSDRKYDALQNMATAPLTLHDHLTEQLAYLDLDVRLHALTVFVISHLDDNGYLLGHDADRQSIYPIHAEDLAASYSDQPTAVDEIEEAIRVVQSLEPAGVCGRDARECLTLQVTEDTPHSELVRTLIRDHLEDVGYNRLPLIQKRTGHDLDTIAEAIEELRKLDPKPGALFAESSTRYIVPDVVVERTDDGGFDVRLTEDWMPSVRFSKKYVPLTKDRTQSPQMRLELKKKMQSANWLLTAIEQRRDTLIRVTREIIAHQRQFLEEGPDHIQPLKMEQIADRVGVHVTTVSRAVDDKWVQTPRGVFPLRRFFGGGTKNQDTGEDVAWETIKQKLLEFIGAEDKKDPLSDEDIMKKFLLAGLKVARRTVTKYREALKIPSSRQRRDWTG